MGIGRINMPYRTHHNSGWNIKRQWPLAKRWKDVASISCTIDFTDLKKLQLFYLSFLLSVSEIAPPPPVEYWSKPPPASCFSVLVLLSSEEVASSGI